ncbi:glycosyl hydrolase family 28-related protein [Geodermatophilus sp. SYSU D00758]
MDELTRRSFLVRGAVAVAGAVCLAACRSGTGNRAAPRPDVPGAAQGEVHHGGVFDVRDRGALGDGIHDDTVAVQATIDAAQRAGGGVVYLPAGVYRLQPQVARQVDPEDNIDEGHALSVTGSGLTFRGDGRDRSRLVFHAFGGEVHETSWQVVDGKVFRGAGFFLDGGASAATAQTDIAFEDLSLDGTAHCTHDNDFPADVGTGDGWDLTHKGIWMRNDRAFDRIRVSRCRVHGWKGEIVYYGGIDLGRYTVEDCELYDTNGDCNSVTASWLTAVRNTLHTSASAGFEDMLAEGPGGAVYADNTMYACDKEALSLGSAGSQGPWGPIVITRNTVSDCPRTGFLLFTSATAVTDNLLTDCAYTPGWSAIHVRTTTDRPLRDVHIERNRIEAVTRAVRTGIVVEDPVAAGIRGVTVKDNWAGVPPAGVRNGASFTQAYGLGVADATDVTVEGNDAVRTTYQYTDLATTTGSLIMHTRPVDVVELRPPVVRDYTVWVSYRVVREPTTVRVDLTFFDATGTRHSVRMAGGLKEVGHHTTVPVTVTAGGSTEEHYVRVTVTAGAAHRVYVDASITEA